jgi:hypothetical protein
MITKQLKIWSIGTLGIIEKKLIQRKINTKLCEIF